MIVFGARAAYRAFALDAVVEPHTEAAVLAADDDWLAQLRGDHLGVHVVIEGDTAILQFESAKAEER
jgi:hypothetical protein